MGFKIHVLKFMTRIGLSKLIIKSLDKEQLSNILCDLIQKATDKQLDDIIKNCKEGDLIQLDYIFHILESKGITINMLLQWAENEKFLREHRKQYKSPASGSN